MEGIQGHEILQSGDDGHGIGFEFLVGGEFRGIVIFNACEQSLRSLLKVLDGKALQTADQDMSDSGLVGNRLDDLSGDTD